MVVDVNGVVVDVYGVVMDVNDVVVDVYDVVDGWNGDAAGAVCVSIEGFIASLLLIALKGW